MLFQQKQHTSELKQNCLQIHAAVKLDRIYKYNQGLHILLHIIKD